MSEVGRDMSEADREYEKLAENLLDNEHGQ